MSPIQLNDQLQRFEQKLINPYYFFSITHMIRKDQMSLLERLEPAAN